MKNVNLNVPLTSVEDFVPDGMLDKSFLEGCSMSSNSLTPEPDLAPTQEEAESER